ncbi:MAG: glycosyltransferase family 2 protein [Gaiellaceae bacterium]
MSRRPLSIVIPVYNARPYISETIRAAIDEVERSAVFDAELVVVDDGSTDGSGEAARLASGDRLPFRLVEQPNRGRFEARRAGLEAARHEWVLLVDSRVQLEPGGLSFVAEQLDLGARVFNGHVDVAVEGNPFAAFSKLLAELGWSEYFDHPRSTSFGEADFDRFPKGTGCFFAPRELLLDAFTGFVSLYEDSRHSSDDTHVLRRIVESERFHISPRFACRYQARSSPRAFLRFAFDRGVHFPDSYGRPGSRFFPAVVAFYPLSAAAVAASSRRRWLIPAAGAAVVLATALVAGAKRKDTFETCSFAALAPVYALAHGAGMWYGLVLAGKSRLIRRISS